MSVAIGNRLVLEESTRIGNQIVLLVTKDLTRQTRPSAVGCPGKNLPVNVWSFTLLRVIKNIEL
ncbi:MAG: hypothetical protein WBW41_08680 [Verrucomicrobiia bacterium]